MQARGEARWARHNNNTWHANKCKLHTVMRGVSAAGLEEGAVVASEVIEARLYEQLVLWVEACSKRALLASLLLGLMVRGWRSRPSAAVEAVFAAYPGLHPRLNAVLRYEHDINTVDDVGKKLETSFANSLTELFLLRLEQAVALAGPGGERGDKAWLERGVNRGSLVRHVVDTSRQLKAAHVSWQLDWAHWQAAERQRSTRPYRPSSPFALTPGCNCKAHHIKLDTKAIFGLIRAAGMLPADITFLTKFKNGRELHQVGAFGFAALLAAARPDFLISQPPLPPIPAPAPPTPSPKAPTTAANATRTPSAGSAAGGGTASGTGTTSGTGSAGATGSGAAGGTTTTPGAATSVVPGRPSQALPTATTVSGSGSTGTGATGTAGRGSPPAGAAGAAGPNLTSGLAGTTSGGLAGGTGVGAGSGGPGNAGVGSAGASVGK
ncbi:hypothetical protein QJQ45_002007 [Haematococcus lacustris]|nr:hypothetical protein QJQ45_002007 [Haematococcus lacustris]